MQFFFVSFFIYPFPAPLDPAVWFYPGGYAWCYNELSAPDVLFQEEYDVHINNFVFLLLGTTWVISLCSVTHFCTFALS